MNIKFDIALDAKHWSPGVSDLKIVKDKTLLSFHGKHGTPEYGARCVPIWIEGTYAERVQFLDRLIREATKSRDELRIHASTEGKDVMDLLRGVPPANTTPAINGSADAVRVGAMYPARPPAREEFGDDDPTENEEREA